MTTYKAKEVSRIEVWTQYEQPVSKQFKEACFNFESLAMHPQAAMSSEEREGLEHKLQNLRPTLTAHPDALLTRYRLMTMMVGAYMTEMGRLIFSGTLDEEARRQLEEFQQKQARALAQFARTRRLGAAANKAKAKERRDIWLELANDLITRSLTGIHDTDSMVNYIRGKYPGRDRDIRPVVEAAKRAARKALK